MKEKIKKLGFKHIGNWSLSNNNIRFKLTDKTDKKEVLYAFMVSNEIKYIGKTISGLDKRFSGYQNPGHTQSTNIKNNRRIKEELEKGNNVDIYILEEEKPMYYKNIKINLAAGLEDSLIEEFKSAWNRLGRT